MTPPWPEFAGVVTGAPFTPSSGWARRLAAGPPVTPAPPPARPSWRVWRSVRSGGCCHLNLGTPIRPRWGTCCTMAGIPGRPPTRTCPPIPPMPRTAAKRERLERSAEQGRDLRAGSLRNITSRLRGGDEVKTSLSPLIRNRTETTPSQETTHISRSEIFNYVPSEPKQIRIITK